eukprot:NODE_3055_length_604_cov_101.001802_g2554_i0.p2 GENE.NODE_3055_length_604_cov_101.001802_g2554_i0~~NODE_3055_length_604_cov_101.001802_g2554_i0.p2  ORF type:complete len:83 (-),score=22.24 NODE_3055_length_604_cov_101.001802_g2554_i0:4-252(-)
MGGREGQVQGCAGSTRPSPKPKPKPKAQAQDEAGQTWQVALPTPAPQVEAGSWESDLIVGLAAGHMAEGDAATFGGTPCTLR